MFLLLLMGLGAAGVKAQVRIGGNVAPNAATVLDLNTNNNANPAGNKGLGLPRVTLVNDTTMLTPGVANLNGMMVCNTTNTLGGVGLYYWSTNSAKWVKVNLPPTSAADSGKILSFNGTSWALSYGGTRLDTTSLSFYTSRRDTVSFALVLDTVVSSMIVRPNSYIQIPTTVLIGSEFCTADRSAKLWVKAYGTNLIVMNSTPSSTTGVNQRFRCYRPSL